MRDKIEISCYECDRYSFGDSPYPFKPCRRCSIGHDIFTCTRSYCDDFVLKCDFDCFKCSRLIFESLSSDGKYIKGSSTARCKDWIFDAEDIEEIEEQIFESSNNGTIGGFQTRNLH